MKKLDRIRMKLALALFPRTEEKTLTKKEIAELTETNVSGSMAAAVHVKKYLKKFNIPVLADYRLKFGKWHAHLIKTPEKNICVVFKRYFMWNFERMFNLPEGTGEGTGINHLLYQYCKKQGVEEVFIVRPTGKVLIMWLKDLEEFNKKYHAVRKEKEGHEIHLPVSMLKPWLVTEEVET